MSTHCRSTTQPYLLRNTRYKSKTAMQLGGTVKGFVWPSLTLNKSWSWFNRIALSLSLKKSLHEFKNQYRNKGQFVCNGKTDTVQKEVTELLAVANNGSVLYRLFHLALHTISVLLFLYCWLLKYFCFNFHIFSRVHLKAMHVTQETKTLNYHNLLTFFYLLIQHPPFVSHLDSRTLK